MLYVPFSYVEDVRDDTVLVSLTADVIPDMQWDVRPDFLANHQVPDSGAGPLKA